MKRTIPVDLDLACSGYLTLPNQTLRFIYGLDELAVETVTLGATVWWAELPSYRPALAYCQARDILLADWLSTLSPRVVRKAWCHELSHLHVGRSEERAEQWQRAHYVIET